MSDLPAGRRDLLLAPLLAALPLATSGVGAGASPINPRQTILRLPNDIAWRTPRDFPHGIDVAPLSGSPDAPGLYCTLVRWHPGWMSAPHSYATDRLCVVLSGTWWINSGDDFDPDRTVPAPAGSFVRRVARTPHYDGVKRDGREPAVIAIAGIGPVDLRLSDPDGPHVRQV